MMVSSVDDSRIKDFEEKLSEIEDFQLLNKLDIIAIKEQLEHIEKLSQSLTPETQQRLAWVEQITKSDKFQSIEKLIDEVHNIESTIEQAKTGLSAEQIDSIKGEISSKVEQDISLLKQKLGTEKPVAIGAESNDLINEVEALKVKIASVESSITSSKKSLKSGDNDLNGKIQEMDSRINSLVQSAREQIKADFDAELQSSSNKIYSELRSSIGNFGKELGEDSTAVKNLIGLKNDFEGFKTEIKNELDSKFTDLESRLKPVENYGDFKNELKAEVDKIRDFTMRDLNEKMNELQLTMSKSGMDETKRDIYEDFHKFKISIIDQISKSAEDVEAKITPQVNAWHTDAEKTLQKNKDAYAELVKFRIATMDEIANRTKEIKESMMSQVPAEIHAMRVDIDNKINQFQQQVSEIKLLKTDVEDFRKTLERSKVGELDRLSGEVERVKARGEWLEDELLKKDMTSLIERTNDLEMEIDKVKALMPVVLE
ncbi:MAG: hypothetical protein V1836_02360 [Candidatus Aenigmatarchaeota archaeon]